MRALSIVCGFVALCGGLVGQTPTYLNPNDSDPSASNQGTVKIFHLGPFTIPAGSPTNPGELDTLVTNVPNPGDVWVTGYDNRIVDTNRVPVDQAAPNGTTDFYLHHAVFLNGSVSDLSCPVMPGERFVASGGERIPIALPNGYGYRIFATDRLYCLLHMQNFTPQQQTVYLQYSLTVLPGSTPLTAVRPWWLDVVQCTSSYTVPAGSGSSVKQLSYFAPKNMSILTMGPHLHCGGMQIDLLQQGQPFWTFTNNPNACPVQMQAVIPNPPLTIPRGASITIKATYQQNASQNLDAMGIVLLYAVMS